MAEFKECTRCDKDGYRIEQRKVDGYNYMLDFAVKCECGKHERLKFNSKLQKSGIGDNFKSKNFENYITPTPELQKIKETCKIYARDFLKMQFEKRNSLYICGAVGSGKTHLATAISNQLLQSAIQVEYFEYREKMTKLKQIITDNQQYEREMRCKKTKVLFIDDFLKGKITESDINIIYELINYRYQVGLPMIITSERNIVEILQIDEAIGSRLAEMCNIVKIGAENHRLRG